MKAESPGFPAESYGLHSLRASGATAAANGGVPDILFKDMATGDLTLPRMVISMLGFLFQQYGFMSNCKLLICTFLCKPYSCT